LGYEAIWRVWSSGRDLIISPDWVGCYKSVSTAPLRAPATNCLIVLYHLSGGKHMAKYVLVAVVNATSPRFRPTYDIQYSRLLHQHSKLHRMWVTESHCDWANLHQNSTETLCS
jgi:hypothetical protein